MTKITLLKTQKEFLEIPHNEKMDAAVYQGGFGSGKTFAGCLLGILMCLKYPKIKGLSGAETYVLLRETTLATYFEILDLLGLQEGKEYSFLKNSHKIIFKNGSEILFRPLENSERLKSLNLGFIQIEEMSQVSEKTFKVLLSRLRQKINQKWKNFQYRIFGHTNPESKKGWIYKRFIEDNRANYRHIIAPTTENIHLSKHYIEELKKAYDSEYFRVNVLGEFAEVRNNLVVKGFCDENIKKIYYQENLPMHISCDFNVDPMCWILAHKTDDKVFFFDEIVLENTTTVECVEEIATRYPSHKGSIVINGDASGDNRSCTSEFSNYILMRKRLSELGFKNIVIKIRSFNPSIKNRILAWNSKIKNSIGERSIIIDPKCKWLIYNCNNLKFKEGTSVVDVPSHYQIKKDKELKFLEHPFDAASYLVEFYWPII